MHPSPIDTQLQCLKVRIQEVGFALSDGNPAEVQTGSETLLSLAVELAQMTHVGGQNQCAGPDQTLRIVALSSDIVSLRESLMRRSAYVDRALEVLVPAACQKPTYSGGGVFGGPIRRSGKIIVLSA